MTRKRREKPNSPTRQRLRRILTAVFIAIGVLGGGLAILAGVIGTFAPNTMTSIMAAVTGTHLAQTHRIDGGVSHN